MKANKTITLDMDLILSIQKLGLNVSEYCNEKLWDYVTTTEQKVKEVKAIDYNAQIRELKEKQKELENKEIQTEERVKAGITDELLLFLKSMNTNIMAAKDMKLAYKNKFGKDISWAELINLKKEWT